MRNRINPELLAALRARHGQVFVQALTAERHFGPEMGCLEMLELSEIAHRLRSHVREVIRDCRKREARAAGCTCAEPGSVTATNALAEHWLITPDHLVIGNGCDEIILNTFLKFSVSGEALITANTYPGYREIANLANQRIKEIPLKSWRSDVDAIVASITSDTKLAIICNPHNPTGSLLEKEEIDHFIEACSEQNIIPVIDEAYIDFSEKGASLIPSIDNYDRLIIWRSFAKSHGLAGIRLGAAVGTPSLIKELKMAAESNPFSVNRIAQRMILEITKDEGCFEQNRRAVKLTRTFMEKKLEDLGIWHNHSHTNFLFIKPPGTLTARSFFEQTGVFVRDCEGYGLPGYWRVSCGSNEEMKAFVDGIESFPRPTLSGGDEMKKLYFQKSPGSFAICRCPPETTMLDGYNEDSIVALVKTETETTLIVKEDSLPQHCNAVDTGWVLFKITGEFAFDEAGVVLSAIKPLSENDIGVFVLSTYSSDIVLIKEKNLTKAKNHLQNNGHSVTG